MRGVTRSPHVLGVRLAPPEQTRPMLVRPRLLSVLRQRWERRVTVVVGGPGFGKTTLLSQALAENRLDPTGIDAWVRCEPSDAAASVLAEALCKALGAPRPVGTDVERLAEAVADAVLVHAPTPVALVLDDVHQVPEGSDGAAFLAALVARLPPRAHLVLGSRRKPPIPLARLVAQGDAVRLVEADLAFTAEEVQAFAEARGVPADSIAHMGTWPAIAELVASAGEGIVRDYLWEEALAAMTPARRRGLAVLAGIGGGDQAVLEAASDGPVDIEELTAEVPLVSTGSDGWVELHALWRDELDSHLDEDGRRSAQRRAADHLLGRGERLRAFGLLTEAGAWDEACSLILEVCSHLYVPVATDVLSGWLTVLEAARGEGHPLVLLLTAVLSAEQETGLETSLSLLAEAQAEFRARSDTDGEMACLIHLFAFSYSIPDEGVLVAALARAFELEAEGYEPATPMARLGRVGLADFMGDYRGALRELDAGPLSALDAEWVLVRSWMRADLLEVTGQPDAALDVVERCEHTRADQLYDVLESARTQALWACGRVDEATERGEPAVGQSRGPDARRADQAANALAARYAAYLGEAEVARACLRTVETLGPPADRIIEHRSAIGRAALAVLDGDEPGARDALTAVLGDDPGPAAVRSKMARRVLPLVYVLIPQSRAAWDAEDLGPTLDQWRALARALVSLREDGATTGVAQLGAVPPGGVRAGLPLPWAVDLAVALESLDRAESRELLTALGRRARPFIDLLAAESGPLQRSARRLRAEIPATPDTTTEVRLLGPVELVRREETVDSPEWRRERVRQLMAYLMVHRRATREAVADALWPDLDAEAAANNLRGTLSHLLAALQPERKRNEASYYVAQRGRMLVLTGTDLLEADLWAFERHLRAAEEAEQAGTPSVALRAYRRAIALWRGPFLGDSPAGWAENEAERLRTRFVAAASRAAELTLAGGDGSEAERLADAVLAVEPWSERSYRVLAAAQLDRGDRTAALQTLKRCGTMLEELGVEPEPATAMLERQASAHL